MDRTLRRAKRGSRRRRDRNAGAWRRFYRPATEKERNSSVTLYRHDTPEHGPVLVKRITVAAHAELITAFCVACANAMGTAQVLCYQRTTAVGEVVGIDANGMNPSTKGEST